MQIRTGRLRQAEEDRQDQDKQNKDKQKRTGRG
jgi:hypothetical protein